MAEKGKKGTTPRSVTGGATPIARANVSGTTRVNQGGNTRGQTPIGKVPPKTKKSK